MSHPVPRGLRGFTLIEVMITVVIIGILAMIAVPAYGNYVLRANRAVGKTAIMRIATQQESYFTDRKQYATSLPALSSTEYGTATTVYVKRDGTVQAANTADTIYAVTLTGASATAYAVQAVPVHAQARDTACGTLTYTSTGTRTVSGTATDCWTR